MAQTVKNVPAIWETQVWSLGGVDPLEKGMATHSSILAWRIPWTEELGRLQSMGSQRVRHDWATETHTWERQIIAFIELLFSKGMAQMVKNLPGVRETWVWSGFDPWVGKISWRKEWQPTQVFLPGEFHGQGSLAVYSPWVAKSRTQLTD